MKTITRWCNGCGKRVPLTEYTRPTPHRPQKRCDRCLEVGR